MIEIIREWTNSKNTNDFNYNEALKTLRKDKSIVNQSIEDYIHFDFTFNEIKEKFEVIENINQENIYNILEHINKYTYYLKMNRILKFEDDKNTKKLKQLNKILDNEFINFLDKYLYLDRTILSSKDSLKITDNYDDVIKFYLENDFKFALKQLENFFRKNTVRTDSIEIEDKNITNSMLVKPKTYLTPIGKRAILKCLYFDLLYNFEVLTKEQSKEIIENFFISYFDNEKSKLQDESDFRILQDKKTEHTLTAETIKYIQSNKDILNFDSDISKTVKNEIRKIFNIKEFINDNFIPLFTSNSTLNDK